MAEYRNLLIDEKLAAMSPKCASIYDRVEAFVQSAAPDIKRLKRKTYVAYKRDHKLAALSIDIRTSKDIVLLYLNLDPDDIELIPGFTRDVRNVGHNGTGKVEVRLSSLADFSKAKSLIKRSLLSE